MESMPGGVAVALTGLGFYAGPLAFLCALAGALLALWERLRGDHGSGAV
jgi:hypothetical protein